MNDQKKDKRKLAADRTDWALHRTLLAKERTVSAWVRTGLVSVAGGLGIARLLEDLGAPELTRTVGVLFVLSGLAMFGFALWRYQHGYHEIRKEGETPIPLWVMSILIVILLGAALLAIIIIFE